MKLTQLSTITVLFLGTLTASRSFAHADLKDYFSPGSVHQSSLKGEHFSSDEWLKLGRCYMQGDGYNKTHYCELFVKTRSYNKNFRILGNGFAQAKAYFASSPEDFVDSPKGVVAAWLETVGNEERFFIRIRFGEDSAFTLFVEQGDIKSEMTFELFRRHMPPTRPLIREEL